jgi:Skp family chaperone for outer membrane proteins
MSQNLEEFFKLEHTEYLKIRRNIKQKLVNLVKRIHNKAFGDDEQEEED